MDTNVCILVLFGQDAPYQILKRILGANLNFVSPQILEELKERLFQKFKLPPKKVNKFLEIIIFISKILYSKKKFDIVKEDRSDIKLLNAFRGKSLFYYFWRQHLLKIKS